MKPPIAAWAVLLLFLTPVPKLLSTARPLARLTPEATAPAPRAQTSAKIHRATGEVLAVSPGSLVLLHARGRTKQRMAFTLTSETKMPSSTIKSERVTVFYREAGGRRIATRIRSAVRARRER